MGTKSNLPLDIRGLVSVHFVVQRLFRVTSPCRSGCWYGMHFSSFRFGRFSSCPRVAFSEAPVSHEVRSSPQ
jgi:hypothetical protein